MPWIDLFSKSFDDNSYSKKRRLSIQILNEVRILPGLMQNFDTYGTYDIPTQNLMLSSNDQSRLDQDVKPHEETELLSSYPQG